MKTGRKKTGKPKDKNQGSASSVETKSIDKDNGGTYAIEDKDQKRKEMGAEKDTSETATKLPLSENTLKTLDLLLKETGVGEVLRLGSRDEMLGLTPLSMAAAIGHVEGTRKLLEAGAPVDDRSHVSISVIVLGTPICERQDGSTALLNAAYWRHLPVLELLLQHGANVAAIDNEGNNALMVATHHGDVRIINSLWPHRKLLDINHANKAACTALHLAAARRWESCVHFLILNGAEVNRQNALGQTPLHIAAAKGDQPIAERMVGAGASLLLEDNEGHTPFCVALRNSHDFLAGYLLAKLKVEDKKYFCKRRSEKLQTLLRATSRTVEEKASQVKHVMHAILCLTLDPGIRDSLHQCDFMALIVNELQRQELCLESAAQGCLVCCELMFNPFPVPDEWFVQEFLAASGPEVILDRLENVGARLGMAVDRTSPGGQGVLVQTHCRFHQEQIQAAFGVLLPVLALVETHKGREWLTNSSNQQRLVTVLHYSKFFPELLKMAGGGSALHANYGNECKINPNAILERFLVFFNALETQNRENKVRELLEQEEREKSRKERKREKKRQHRLKQKTKSRGADMLNEMCKPEMMGRGSCTGARTISLDALDDIPLMIGPDGVQDVPNCAAAMIPQPSSDSGIGEDEWMMVGGKRSYPIKSRFFGIQINQESKHSSDLQQTETQSGRFYETKYTESQASSAGSKSPAVLSDVTTCMMGECELTENQLSHLKERRSSECSCSDKVSQEDTVTVETKCNSRGGMRWADIARFGSSSINPENARASAAAQSSPCGPSKWHQGCVSARVGKDTYNHEFPCLAEKESSIYENRKQNDVILDNVIGVHNNLPNESCTSQVDHHKKSAQHEAGNACACHPRGSETQTDFTSGTPGTRKVPSGVDPVLLYQALSGWMWRYGLAKGSNPSQSQIPPELFLKNQLYSSSSQSVNCLNSKYSDLNNAKKANNIEAESMNRNLQDNQKFKTISNICEAQQLDRPDNVLPTSSFSFLPIMSPCSLSSQGKSAGPSTGSSSLSMQRLHSVTDTKIVYPYEAIYAKPFADTTRKENLFDSSSLVCPNIGSDYLKDDVSTMMQTVKESKVSDVSNDESNRFLWPSSKLSDWPFSQLHSVITELEPKSPVYGTPVYGCNELYGVPRTSADFKDTRTLDFCCGKDTEHTPYSSTKYLHSTPGPCTFSRVTTPASFSNRTDVNLAQEMDKTVETNTFASSLCDLMQEKDARWVKQKSKTRSVVVSVSRSSDSDSPQSSPTQQASEISRVANMSPARNDLSSSSFNSWKKQFHRSRSASCADLHECLAPGFLRAAIDAPKVRLNDAHNYVKEQSSVFKNIYGNFGLLALGHPSKNDNTKTSDQGNDAVHLYPDLSTVPERDTPWQNLSTTIKSSPVVGQGRDIPSESDRQKETDSPSTKSAPDSNFDWTLLRGSDCELALAEERARNTCFASGQLLCTTSSCAAGLRPHSPDVLFPETLRSDAVEQPSAPDVFPSIHDMSERDLFQDVFSNSYFLEQIAIDQIRRRLRALGGGKLFKQSLLYHDLDYYASLYGVRLRDVLGPHDEGSAVKPDESDPLNTSPDQGVLGWKTIMREPCRRNDGRMQNPKDSTAEDITAGMTDVSFGNDWPWHSAKVTAPRIVTTEEDVDGKTFCTGSRRWRPWLKQILDMPWTMRRQYGKIVLPARSMEFNVARTGSHPLVLGFLTDGTEVAVLGLDRTRHALDTRLMATVAADSEPDVHFVLRYKAVWECAGRVYLAMELCDYTLDEYVSIVRLDHRQDPLSANRLAWQMLKGLKYLHSNFAVPHGNLMPGWIFVDCDGRMRLAGYGLRDVLSSARGGCRDWSYKMTFIEEEAHFWRATEHVNGLQTEPSFQADIQVTGMLLHYILTGGRHPFGDSAVEIDSNLRRNMPRPSRVSQEADHLITAMLTPDADARPTVDTCLKHPFFWSGEKRFRLVLIVGSDILTEMKTGVPLTGPGSTSMLDILNVVHVSAVSDNWLSEVDPALVKEMRSFRQYKNTLPELVLFVYNCCLHFDKMSPVAKELLDDPCKYFQAKFPALFMAVYRAMRASDRMDRTCYKPFF